MAQNKSLSTQEVAELLHVSKSTIYELIRRGEINSYKIGRKVRFTQDDVDAYIARSRHEQSVQPVKRIEIHSALLKPETTGENAIVISGQDVVLDILTNYLHQSGVSAQRCYLNSFEGLLALYEGRVDAAACHLYDAEEKAFNTPFVKKLLPGVPAALINVSYRSQGFYVAAGNPKEISGWRDLARRDIAILNRGVGSSARILLDGQLHRMKLDAREIKGYDREMSSHLTMAAAIAEGEADLAVGTERISRQIDGLDFIPLLKERFDLVVRKDFLESERGEKLLAILRSAAFRKEIRHFTGNDYRDIGKIMAEV
ncbi:MAG: helix-turn-helix transcriptional regulator [Oscillospiraceae bacterium]|nr:helix-turn-helix transcriptional regulator [Oscillospiraceae bacterium]